MPDFNESYIAQTRLLLTVLPFVSRRPDFALKGGTAINFFYREGPRLSVDIDLHYLPDHPRDRAIAGIRANMQAIGQSLERALPGCYYSLHPTTSNARVAYQNATIKIEPNSVIRGTLLPPEVRTLSNRLADRFDTEPQVACVAHAELFAGKLCAALQRQHPRDLFDIHLLLTEEDGLTRELMDAFIVYLISQGKPIFELLAPTKQPIDDLYRRQFAGMTAQPVTLDQLKEIQQTLPELIRARLTEADRSFLVGFKRGTPDWQLIRHSHAEALPAVRWKQFNLERMVARKREDATQRLAHLLSM